jgi:hypothetical protein
MSDQAFGSVQNPARSYYPFVRIVEVGWGGGIGILQIDFPSGIDFTFMPDSPGFLPAYSANEIIPVADYKDEKIDELQIPGSGRSIQTLYTDVPTYYYFIAASAQCCGSPGLECDAPPDLSAQLGSEITHAQSKGFTVIDSGITVVMGNGPSNPGENRYSSWGAPVLRPADVNSPVVLVGYDRVGSASQTLYDPGPVSDVFSACNVDDPNNFNNDAWYIIKYTVSRSTIRQFWLINFKNEKEQIDISNAGPTPDPNLPGGANITATLNIYGAGVVLTVSEDGNSINSSTPPLISQQKIASYDAAGTLFSITKTGFV